MRGWMGVWELDVSGDLVHGSSGGKASSDSEASSGEDTGDARGVGVGHEREAGNVKRWETPTSGGKANAISLLPKRPLSSSSSKFGSSSLEFDTRPPMHGRRHAVPPPLEVNTTQDQAQHQEVDNDGLWILLTDDCAGLSDEQELSSGCGAGVRVLDWTSGEGVRGVVAEWPVEGSNVGEEGERMRGGSHAVWLD